MLIGPDTTLADVEAEIADAVHLTKRLYPGSDEHAEAHAQLDRLCRLRDAYAIRDSLPPDLPPPE